MAGGLKIVISHNIVALNACTLLFSKVYNKMREEELERRKQADPNPLSHEDYGDLDVMDPFDSLYDDVPDSLRSSSLLDADGLVDFINH